MGRINQEFPTSNKEDCRKEWADHIEGKTEADRAAEKRAQGPQRN